MKTTLSDPPVTEPLRAEARRMVALAFQIPHLPGAVLNVASEFYGAISLQRRFTQRLDHAGIKYENEAPAAPALSSAVFMWSVADLPGTLHELRAALRADQLHAAFGILGYFDPAEKIWRTYHPKDPHFDFHARVSRALVFSDEGAEMPEFTRVMAQLLEYNTAVMAHLRAQSRARLENPS